MLGGVAKSGVYFHATHAGACYRVEYGWRKKQKSRLLLHSGRTP
jgi:hypothetical protein